MTWTFIHNEATLGFRRYAGGEVGTMSPLHSHVATEIKVWMARRNVDQNELARRVGHSQPWVSTRLTGKTAISLDDLAGAARDCYFAAVGVAVPAA